jgi:hypothetical protein
VPPDPGRPDVFRDDEVFMPHRFPVPPAAAARAAAWACCAATLLAAAAQAQPARPATAAAKPDPLDARAPVPPATHLPALRAYRPAGDTPVGSWKDANDTVTRIGGWRVYLREATQPEPAAAARPASAPASGAHGGHPRGHHGPR